MQWLTKVNRVVSHLFHPQRSNNYRPRILHPESLFAISLLAIVIGLGFIRLVPSFSQTLGSVLGYASDINVASVIAETNDQRLRLGLKPLSESPLLTLAAKKKATDMFQKQYWAHIAPDGTKPWHFMKLVGYDYRYAGENLAKNFAVTDDLLAAWMHSPKHRENILNPHYTQIGVAVSDGVLNGVETTLVVQMFGQPQHVLPAIAAGTHTSIQPHKTRSKARTKEMSESNKLNSQVLAQATISRPLIPQLKPTYSPLILIKSFFFSIGFMLMLVLVYDLVMIRENHRFRLVGKNFAHLLLLGTIMFLIFYFKAGVIG